MSSIQPDNKTKKLDRFGQKKFSYDSVAKRIQSSDGNVFRISGIFVTSAVTIFVFLAGVKSNYYYFLKREEKDVFFSSSGRHSNITSFNTKTKFIFPVEPFPFYNMTSKTEFLQSLHSLHFYDFTHFKEIPSTQDWALVRAVETPLSELPFLVLADRQTAGRGRGDHKWFGSDGTLMFSIAAPWTLLGLSRRESSELSLRIAHTVADVLNIYFRQYNSNSTAVIKIPNDIYINEKKIGGILIESPTPDLFVAGIGINLNSRLEDAPEELKIRITSLYDLVHRKTDRLQFLIDLLTVLFV